MVPSQVWVGVGVPSQVWVGVGVPSQVWVGVRVPSQVWVGVWVPSQVWVLGDYRRPAAVGAWGLSPLCCRGCLMSFSSLKRVITRTTFSLCVCVSVCVGRRGGAGDAYDALGPEAGLSPSDTWASSASSPLLLWGPKLQRWGGRIVSLMSGAAICECGAGSVSWSLSVEGRAREHNTRG